MMGSAVRLNDDERHFFELVSRAVRANPFGGDRPVIDLEISGLKPDSTLPERLAATIATVNARVDVLESQARADIRHYAGRDRILMEHAMLFDVFHRNIQRLDQFILDQVKAGEPSLKVPFGREILGTMERRGFDPEDALRYLSLFFQLRRAFFFIQTALIGRSPCMMELRRKLWNNVFTHDIDIFHRFLWNRMEDFSTLLLGETGTGKGTAAAAIGRSGFIPFDVKKDCFVESFNRSFVAINLSEHPESLIESELFGHRKGAFTGAVDHFEGVFARCSPHGSIFLDEIGEVTGPVQIKLLRVIQERWFSPVGGHERKRFSGRVIAATNRSIDALRGGVMREDFYYRLCSDVITVPPLRQRIEEDSEELTDLIGVTLKRILGEASPEMVVLIRDAARVSPGPDYPWPGNVRELEQCVRRILLNRLYERDARSTAGDDLTDLLLEGVKAGALDAQTLMSGYCALLYRRHGTYEAVSRRTGLDRRTAKRYVDLWGTSKNSPVE